MKVYFTPEAEEQVDEIDLWWRANRLKAPGLFARELAEAKVLAHLGFENPNRQ